LESGADAKSEWSALCRAVRDSTLAVGLVHLPTRRFIELSSPAASLLGLEGVDLASVDVTSLSDDAKNTRKALGLVAEGVLDGYQTRRRLRTHDGRVIDSHISVRVIARNDDGVHGLAFICDAGHVSNTPGESDTPVDGSDAEALLMVGIVDASHRIQGISSEVEHVTGRTATDIIFHSLLDLVHPGDVAAVLSVFDAATDPGTQATGIVRVRDGDGGWHRMRLVAARLGDGTGRFGFALGPFDEGGPTTMTADRVVNLEHRLRRIAREVEAAGVVAGFDGFPDPETLPALRDLTSRQWEIITRLLRGERVPTIASHMYLSQSTVRNHLASIFRKVGVHSQPELLEYLRAKGGTESPGNRAP
jgi:DNA-binding CsgD family transcriptional regulator/PAS domain-containing protein